MTARYPLPPAEALSRKTGINYRRFISSVLYIMGVLIPLATYVFVENTLDNSWVIALASFLTMEVVLLGYVIRDKSKLSDWLDRTK